METYQLKINLGSDPITAILLLNRLKDAMTMAMMQKIESTGIQDSQDHHFAAWQTIYLEAQHTASTILNCCGGL